jgi:hypothetical protein
MLKAKLEFDFEPDGVDDHTSLVFNSVCVCVCVCARVCIYMASRLIRTDLFLGAVNSAVY